MIPTRKGYYVKAIFGMRMSTLCETRARYEELLRQDLERHDPFQHVVTMIQENTPAVAQCVQLGGVSMTEHEYYCRR
jgi:hypothetical protein